VLKRRETKPENTNDHPYSSLYSRGVFSLHHDHVLVPSILVVMLADASVPPSTFQQIF
jgi:hypothetical protein